MSFFSSSKDETAAGAHGADDKTPEQKGTDDFK